MGGFRWAILAAVAALLACMPATAAAVTYPSDFEERTIVDGLTRPTGMAWAPDGRLFVIEKDGRLKVVRPNATSATEILDISARVNSYWDRGLLGIAVDSDFANNRFIYLLYTYELQPMVEDGSGQMVSRLDRYTVTPDDRVSFSMTLLGTVTPPGGCPDPSNDVDCIPSEGASHSIGSVRSAPDGTLWVGSGDASSFNDVDELAFRTYDERSMAGKLLHIDRQGRGLSGHPFCPANNNLSQVCTKVWAGGFRNPFRFKLRPGGGLTVGDVGWGTTEEIDLVPTASGGGRFYGWPCYEGHEPTGGYRDWDECDGEYAKQGTPQAHLGPVHTYSHVPGVGGSILGGPTYAGPYPQAYQGDIFFGDYAQGFIKRLRPNAQGTPTVRDFATGWTGVDLELTPTGNLAYASVGNFGDGDGSIKQIVYTPGNRSPVAHVQPENPSGPAPLTVHFSGLGSSDPDGDSLGYLWQFGDGETSTLPAPSHSYDAGVYTARLTVSDGRGASNSTTVEVSSGNTPPQPVVSGDSSYRGGRPFTLQASARDEQDGDLPASAFSWDVRVVHAQHVHAVGTYRDRSELTLDAITDHDADAHYQVVVTARDSDGLAAQRTVELHPEKTRVRLNSSPPGATVSYGGREFKAPQELVTAVGYETTVSAGDPFELGGAIFDFTGWSNGGARVQSFAVPPQGAELTANYARRGGVAPSPQPPTPPPADRIGPALRLVAVNARRGRIRGVVSDPSGVAAVRVALRARQKKRRCQWWLASRGRLSASTRRCDRPRWLRARLAATSGNARWLAVLSKRLPAGKFRVLVRARDTVGNVSQPALGRASLIRVRASRKPRR